jgi:hypothetical protein
MKRNISVTQQDIDRATELRQQEGGVSPSNCPIACALIREYLSTTRVYAMPDLCSVTINHWGTGPSFSPTAKMRAFMQRWDKRFLAVPTKFQVEIR